MEGRGVDERGEARCEREECEREDVHERGVTERVGHERVGPRGVVLVPRGVVLGPRGSVLGPRGGVLTSRRSERVAEKRRVWRSGRSCERIWLTCHVIRGWGPMERVVGAGHGVRVKARVRFAMRLLWRG
jgi:hypothetical protein